MKNEKLLNLQKELAEAHKEIMSLKYEIDLLTSQQEAKDAEDGCRLAAIMEASNDAIITLDTKGTIVSWNQAAEEIYGYEADEVLGKNAQLLVPFNRPNEIAEIMSLITKGKSLKNYETRRRKKDGSIIYVILSQIPVTDKNGQVIYCSATVQDITSKVEMKKIIKSSEERFSKAFAINPIAMSILRAKDHKFIEVNPKFCELVGYSRDEILGHTALDLKLWPRESFLTELRIKVKKSNSIKNEEVEIRRKSGEIRQGLNFAEIIDVSGEKCILTFTLDLTEQKTMEKEIGRLHRLNLVGEMAAGIAHEIRNPLTTIRGFLQLLEEKKAFGEYGEYYHVMISEVDKANDIISEYITLAKNKHVEKTPQNLSAIVSRLSSLITSEAMLMDKHVEIDLDVVDDFLLDDKEISQLILHLTRNGLEAVPSGGVVEIYTYTKGDTIVLAVQDNGKGIDPYIQEKLGTPFFTTKEQGLGLGLAACYSIAARHGGTIDFTTGNLGTTFYVRFKQEESNSDQHEQYRELA